MTHTLLASDEFFYLFYFKEKSHFGACCSNSKKCLYLKTVRREFNGYQSVDTTQDLEVFCTSYIKIAWYVFILELSKVLILRVYNALFELAL